MDSKHIERLENAAKRMENQMKDLAEFAKVDNGNIVVNNISFNLAKLIKRYS